MSGNRAESGQCAQIVTAAIRYLSRREYSRRELSGKLLARTFAVADIETVLDNLEEQGYLSDERFAEMFLRSQISRGSGPFKIRMALNQKGVDSALISKLLDGANVNWTQNADKIRRKHFGEPLPTDNNSLSKQIRYLRNKGFYQEHIDAVLYANKRED